MYVLNNFAFNALSYSQLMINNYIKYLSIQQMIRSSLRPNRIKSEEYITIQRIGAGQFGEVEKCEHKQSTKRCAVKTIFVPAFYKDAIEEQAINMMKSNSDYVLEVYDYFYDDTISSFVIVTPYYKHGSVSTLMDKEWELDELYLFIYQISKALFDLQKIDVLHLDLKPDNILIKSPGQYVLCDLGCSRRLDKNNMSISRNINVLKMSAANARGGGTTEYASPDLVQSSQMTPFTDIWSLGVILYKIIYKRHPLALSMSQLDNRIRDFYLGKYTIKYTQKQKYQSIINLTKRMLVCSRDKQHRITWGEIIEQIFALNKIPSSQFDFVITNFDFLLQFVDKVSIVTSSVLYYLKKSNEIIKANGIQTAFLVKQTCIYLLTLTKQLMSFTKQINDNEFQFYLFKITCKNLTKKQKSYAQFLEKQAEKLALNHKVVIQYAAIRLSRDLLVKQYSRLYKLLKNIDPPKKLVERAQLTKLVLTLKFTGNTNELKYQNRKQLIAFSKEIINN